MNRNRFKRASEASELKKKLLFQTIKFIFFYMSTHIFHSLEFPGIVHFPKITRKLSGFPGIRENSFKVETLLLLLRGCYMVNIPLSFVCENHLSWLIRDSFM